MQMFHGGISQLRDFLSAEGILTEALTTAHGRHPGRCNGNIDPGKRITLRFLFDLIWKEYSICKQIHSPSRQLHAIGEKIKDFQMSMTPS